MKSDKDKIKEAIASKLNGFEPELPASMWARIESDLPVDKGISAQPVRRYAVLRYVAWAATAAAAVVLGVVLLYPKGEKGQTENKPAITAETVEDPMPSLTEPTVVPDNSKVLQSQKKTASTKTPRLYSPSSGKAYLAVQQNRTKPDEPVLAKEPAVGPIAEQPATPPKTENLPVVVEDKAFEKELAEQVAVIEDKSKREIITLAENIAPPAPIEEKSGTEAKFGDEKAKNSRFDIGVGGSSSLHKADAMQMQMRSTSLYEFAALEENEVKEVQPQRMKYDHDQPISVGVTISKNLNSRLSLETGLVYTYLHSSARSSYNSELKSKDSQDFHYVGIPLNLNYKLLEWKRLQLYLSAGAMVQKDFYGKLTTRQSLSEIENTEEYIHKRVSQTRPQYSFMGSLGLSYPVYKNLSIYMNVGGSYYFDVNNPYETIYSEKRWLLNLNAGFRFGF
jgi:hypothetical protein